MNKIIFLIALFSIASLCANGPEQSQDPAPKPYTNSYGYIEAGVIVYGDWEQPFSDHTLFPSVMGGYRKQVGKNGCDFGLRCSSLGFATVLDAYGRYLFYPKPNDGNQMYYGTGIGVGVLHTHFWHSHHYNLLIRPEAVVGWNFKTKGGRNQFIQATASPYVLHPLAASWSLGLSYGFGF